MNRSLLPQRSLSSICYQCRQRLLTNPSFKRSFSATTPEALPPRNAHESQPTTVSPLILDIIAGRGGVKAQDETPVYGFHVYAHKHNTHITVTRPDKGPLPGLSLSAGNLGFRKSNRGTFDAAYQLGTYVISRMIERGHLNDIKKIEVVLRGFGIGREAVTKVLLGQEGERVRHLVTRVTDATRLKFGGTRSDKPRRLG